MSNFDKHLEVLSKMGILDQLEDMTPDARLQFVYAVSSIFCLSCGADTPPDQVCYCLHDE